MKFSEGSNFQTIFKVLVIALGAALLVMLGRASVDNNQKQATNTTDPAQPTAPSYKSEEFKHPRKWGYELITEEEKKQEVLIKLQREEPGALLIIRRQGIAEGEAADLAKTADDVVASLESEIEAFKLTSKTTSQLKKVNLIEIEYQSGEGIDNVHNHMTIIPLKDKAYYLIYKTHDAAISSIKKDISEINANFIDYLKAQKIIR